MTGRSRRSWWPRPTAGHGRFDVSPLARLQTDLHTARDRRHAACTAILGATSPGVRSVDTMTELELHGHVALALDIWTGQDFADRNRSRAWSWVPFYEGELDPTPDTDETRRDRVGRSYKLGGDEKSAFAAMRKDPVGEVALAAGHIAARIHAYPAWALDFFDKHTVRVDLEAEVTAIAQSASALRDGRTVLGHTPVGHLRDDADVVNTYIHKARALDRRADGLLERVSAFDSYREIVTSIQRRHEKTLWMERVGSIDDLELAIDDDVERREGARLRDVASESDLYASIYLESLEPLTASLTLSTRSS